jgi:release factor glutamine methyltransferase
MTILEAKVYIKNAMLSLYEERESNNIALLIIEWLSGKSRMEQILDKAHSISPKQIDSLNEAVNRLSKGEPVQYIIGEAWFMGYPFQVNSNTLIPRPETEELVEWILKDVSQAGLTVLEIGTGSGCIPIALKKKNPHLQISSIDISAGALAVAEKNATELNAEIKFFEFDFLKEETWNALLSYDIIVSNPPYIKASEAVTMHQNVLLHEPHNALFVPDNNALLFYQKINTFSKAHLNIGGSIYVEINESLGKEVVDLFSESGYQVELKKDLQGKDRMAKMYRA